MNSSSLSEIAQSELRPLFEKLDRYAVLLELPRSIQRQTLVPVLRAFGNALQGDEAATEIAEREITGSESAEGFVSVVRDDQLETLALLKRNQTEIVQLLAEMNSEAGRLSASETPGVKEAIDYLVGLRSSVTTQPWTLKEQQRMAVEIFQEAMEAIGTHGPGL